MIRLRKSVKSRQRYIIFGLFGVSLILVGLASSGFNARASEPEQPVAAKDSLVKEDINLLKVDSLGTNEADRYTHLTEEDFKLVAEELDVEVAAIKAIVQVEAGTAMRGFFAPGVPVINFDPSMYAIYKSKAPSKAGNKNAKVPEGLSGYALKEWTLLTNARKVNAQGADMGTFWGMFQIGGFNYKICGCESVDEMVYRMSYSELEQLQLFAVFIEKTGMIKYLRDKDWSGFARKYNGPSYARRGYHTKMANAYAKFSKQQESN